MIAIRISEQTATTRAATRLSFNPSEPRTRNGHTLTCPLSRILRLEVGATAVSRGMTISAATTQPGGQPARRAWTAPRPLAPSDRPSNTACLVRCARTVTHQPVRSGDQVNEASDPELLARVGRGDETAFRVLIARKVDRVHGLAARMLADEALAQDVSQETFLRVWRHAGNWREGTATFDTWLHRVVLNLCHDRLRRRRLVFLAEPPDQVDPAIGAEERLSQADVSVRVKRALGRLPRRQREAIVLQTWGELSNSEIGAAMGIGTEALESLLARGRRALRLILEGTDA